MTNTKLPTWLAGRLPPNYKAAQKGKGKSSSHKSNGKSDGSNFGERKRIMQNFVYQLDKALIERSKELKLVHDIYPLGSKLQKAIINFQKVIIKNNDATTKHSGRSPPPTLNNSRGLATAAKIFKLNIENLVPATEHGLLIYLPLFELVADVEHYALSIEMTHSVVRVVDGKPILRNRKKNDRAMQDFGNIVSQYQSSNGIKKYPKLRDARKELAKLNHRPSERTIRYWIAQIKNGTFGNLYQQKNRQ